MDAEMPHQDDVVHQGPPVDPETLALSQHEWLQFEPGSAAAMRCRHIIRMSMGTPRCIDWGVLEDCREAERAAHQVAVRVEEDAELPPDIEFSFEGVDPGGVGGDEGLVGPDLRYAIHRPPCPGDDDQGSSDQIHTPVHRDDHLRSRPEPGVGDYDRSLLSALTFSRQAVQPCTVFRVVLRLLLLPSGAWYTVGWGLYHPHCPDQRHG
ncbi:hypothetical protein R6Q57_021469 [Mikania cordata]